MAEHLPTPTNAGLNGDSSGWNPVVGKSCEQSLRETLAWMKSRGSSAMAFDIAWALKEIDTLRTRTPNASLPPFRGSEPGRKMLITIEVSADFERRLDNQWEVEREIHADRWSWRWAHTEGEDSGDG